VGGTNYYTETLLYELAVGARQGPDEAEAEEENSSNE
jgi:hypothetical protein